MDHSIIFINDTWVQDKDLKIYACQVGLIFAWMLQCNWMKVATSNAIKDGNS